MKKKKAASLIEVMVAVSVLVIALVGLLATFVHCLSWSEHNNNMITAAVDAQSVMEEIKDASYADIVSGFTPQQDYTSLSEETVAVTVDEESQGKEVTVRVTWVEKERTYSFDLKTFFTP